MASGPLEAIMDTRGYVYPPMDDLLKRQNAAGQGDFDPSRSDGEWSQWWR